MVVDITNGLEGLEDQALLFAKACKGDEEEYGGIAFGVLAIIDDYVVIAVYDHDCDSLSLIKKFPSHFKEI